MSQPPFLASYAPPSRAAGSLRPGVVTTLATLSIVFGSLGIVGNLFSGGIGVALVVALQKELASSAGGGMRSTSPAQSLSAADVTVVVEALDAAYPLPPGDVVLLEQLLAEHEVPFTPPPIDSGWTAAYIDGHIDTAGFDEHYTQSHYVLTNGNHIYVGAGTAEFYLYPPDGSDVTIIASHGQDTTVERFGGIPFDLGSAMALVATQGVNVLLAIGLLIAGIMTLRPGPTGRRLHVIWAMLRLVVGLLTLGLTVWVFVRPMEQFPIDTDVGDGLMAGTVFLVPWAVLGMIYPLVVLGVLMSRPLRDWHRPIDAANG